MRRVEGGGGRGGWEEGGGGELGVGWGGKEVEGRNEMLIECLLLYSSPRVLRCVEKC